MEFDALHRISVERPFLSTRIRCTASNSYVLFDAVHRIPVERVFQLEFDALHEFLCAELEFDVVHRILDGAKNYHRIL